MSYLNILHFNLTTTAEKTQNSWTTLIYRGLVYECLLKAQKRVQVSELRKVELIYRGQTYNRLIPVVAFSRPRAVNWRFQVGQ